MTALPTPASSRGTVSTPTTRSAALTLVRLLLLLEAALGLGVAILLSLLAPLARDDIGGASGDAAETTLRFAAAAAFLFAIAAAIAARGVRRRRGWAWTTAAVLQLLLAIGIAVAVIAAEWHPAYLAGFALAGLAMTILCFPGVRRELGQE